MQIKAIIIHPPDWQKTKSDNTKCQQWCGTKGTIFFTAGGSVNWNNKIPGREKRFWCPRTQQSASCVHNPRETHETWIKLSLAALSGTAPNWKQTKCPSTIKWTVNRYTYITEWFSAMNGNYSCAQQHGQIPKTWQAREARRQSFICRIPFT